MSQNTGVLKQGRYVGEEHPPILDYAGPRSHGKLRLPARSVLSIESGEQSYKVVETLAGKEGAIAAIVFALLVLMVLLLQAIFVPGAVRISAVFGPAELLVLLLVIQNTWRKTIVEAHAQGLRLGFKAPFGKHEHRWSLDQIRDLGVVADDDGMLPTVGELQIHFTDSPMARLLSGHEYAALTIIGRAMRLRLGLDQPHAA